MAVKTTHWGILAPGTNSKKQFTYAGARYNPVTLPVSRISVQVVDVFSISSNACGRNVPMSHALQKPDMAIGQGSPFSRSGGVAWF